MELPHFQDLANTNSYYNCGLVLFQTQDRADHLGRGHLLKVRNINHGMHKQLVVWVLLFQDLANMNSYYNCGVMLFQAHDRADHLGRGHLLKVRNLNHGMHKQLAGRLELPHFRDLANTVSRCQLWSHKQ